MRERAKALLNAHPTLWLVLSLPAAASSYFYLTGETSYGQFIHSSGDYAVWLLMATLAVTPLRLMTGSAGWVMWLMRRRRDLGVATFAYALLHTVVYLERKASLGLIWTEAQEPGLATGWIAGLIFAVLAITSNDISVRKLGPAWKRLHRVVYFGAILTFVHWLLVAFDPTTAILHAAALAAIEAVRIGLSVRKRRARRTGARAP
ncbi:MAG: ferric reductase-like transmembrane domain-containing protein [Maricaulaceae bacterium]|jgi:sulfoxide reductase heme-binding subunit YedZ